MDDKGVALDLRIYNSAVEACGDGGDWKMADALLEWMEDDDLEPTPKTSNFAVEALPG